MSTLLLAVDAAGWLGAAVLAVLLANHLRLLAASARFVPPPAAALPEPLPAVLVQIPVFDEPGSVAGALAAAAALDWPADRLVIQLLDDSTDTVTAALAAETITRLGHPGLMHRRRASRDGFKAGALAAGLAESAAEFVAIFDADHRPPPDWLKRTAAVLAGDPGAAFVQTPFRFANAGATPLAGLQALLADAHFAAEQPGRAALREAIQFNGTGALWRVAAIRAAGGWAGDTLAEDLDLALRAQAAGWRGLLMPEPVVVAEAVERPAAFVAQQRRWSQGFVEVARRVLGTIWASRTWSVRQKLTASLLVGLQAALPGAALAALALAADAAVRGPRPIHVALLAGSFAILATAAVLLTWVPFRRLRRGGPGLYLRRVAGLPVLLAALVALNAGAVLAALRGAPRRFVRTPKRGAS